MRKRQVKVTSYKRDLDLYPRAHLWPVDYRGFIVATQEKRNIYTRVMDALAGIDPKWDVVCQRCGYDVRVKWISAYYRDTCDKAPEPVVPPEPDRRPRQY